MARSSFLVYNLKEEKIVLSRMAFASKPPDKFSRYTDATGELSNKSLKVGGWYVAHKVLLRSIAIGVLLVWCVISVGFGIIAWGAYAVDGYFEDRALARRQIQQFQNYTNIQQSYKATALELSPIEIFVPSEGKYDLVSHATNKNDRTIITVEYKFTYEGGETAVNKTVILPHATVPLAVLGTETESYPGNPQLKIEDIKYERISPHQIYRIDDYIAQRSNFVVENVEFIPPQEGVLASRVKFDVTNNTVFTFWEPYFYVEILGGGGNIGILSTTIADFKPGETRTLDIATFTDILGADEIRLTPVMNVFDSSIYQRP